MSAELDGLVRPTALRAWAMVAALAAVLGGGATWATQARVETTVSLDGYLLAGAEPVVLAAPADGVVAELPVPAGRPVAAGAPLVVLEAPGGRQVLTAPAGGVVAALPLRVGDPVGRGVTLAAVDGAGAARLAALLLVDAARPVPAPGAAVRGGWRGRVTAVEPYPVPAREVARRLALPAPPDGAGDRLVRVVRAELSAPSWPGATRTPVRLDVVVGSARPTDALLGRVR
jgi:hypothetical protein